MRDSNSVKRTPLILAGLLLVAAGFKLVLILWDRIPFNADEAIVALMARHILQGQRPAFFYGQAYMGSLDAWLVASGFWFFGQQVWVIRLVQSVLYLGTIATTFALGKVIFRSEKIGLLAACLMTIPTVNVSLYTTASLGGYGEALLLGNLVLLLTIRIANKSPDKVLITDMFLWGFLFGLGWWVFGLTLVYSIPAGLLLLRRIYSRQGIAIQLVVAAAGAITGSLPWGLAAIQHGILAPVQELSGSAILGVEGLSFLGRILQHLYSFVLLGSSVIFGLRPPWGIQWLGLPLLPIILVIWMSVLLFIWKKFLRKEADLGISLLAGVMGTLLVAFLVTPYGADPSGRYFLPLTVPFSLFAADWILNASGPLNSPEWLRRGLPWGLACLIVVYHLWGTLQSALRFPPGLTTQFDSVTQIDQRSIGDLIAFLHQMGEQYGYTNYWVAYPLAFLSKEELIYLPRLPYHQDFRFTVRDDRYRPYNDQVGLADKLAYITTRHPALDQYLRERLSERGIHWEEEQIGDFHIFYRISQPVRPEEIGLGGNQP